MTTDHQSPTQGPNSGQPGQEPTQIQAEMLGQALGECIAAAGITQPGVPLTGPELLMFANDLKQELAARSKGCVWTYNEDGFLWDSSCGSTWTFIDEGPTENHMKFCHSCGCKLIVAEAEQSVDEPCN